MGYFLRGGREEDAMGNDGARVSWEHECGWRDEVYELRAEAHRKDARIAELETRVRGYAEASGNKAKEEPKMSDERYCREEHACYWRDEVARMKEHQARSAGASEALATQRDSAQAEVTRLRDELQRRLAEIAEARKVSAGVSVEQARRQFVVYGGLAAHGITATAVRELEDGALEILDGKEIIGKFRKDTWACWVTAPPPAPKGEAS